MIRTPDLLTPRHNPTY